MEQPLIQSDSSYDELQQMISTQLGAIITHLTTRVNELQSELTDCRAKLVEANTRVEQIEKLGKPEGSSLAEAWRARAERAEAAANDCRRVIAAIPWRALASIYTHPGIVLDADADAIGEFLDQYADEWAGGFGLRLIVESEVKQ